MTTQLYTKAQQLTLIVLPYITAPLSALGCGLVMYAIVVDRQKKLKESYHRLIFGLSTIDFLNSTGMIVFGHWAVPKEVDYVPGARGNFVTCSLNGFFLNLFWGSMWYSFILSLYFLLVIRFEWPEKRIKFVEILGHLLGFVWPIVTGLLSAAMQWLNPLELLPGYCWNSDYPPGCSETEVPCERGEGHEEYISGSTVVLIWIGIVISMALIFARVRTTEKKLQKYAGGQDHTTLKQTRQTGIQSLQYILAFFVTYAPVVCIGAVSYASPGPKVYFAFAFLVKMFTPLQGLFNAIIYFRTRFKKLTETGQSLSFIRQFLHPDPSGAEQSLQENDSQVQRDLDAE